MTDIDLQSPSCKGFSASCLEHNHRIGKEILSTITMLPIGITEEAKVSTALIIFETQF